MEQVFLNLLQDEIKPALGCTEPISIALASARAAGELTGEVKKVVLTLSENILKNAAGVGIPGTRLIGVEYAALLGMHGGDPEKGLGVLEGLTKGHIDETLKARKETDVSLELYKGPKKLYISVRLQTRDDYSEVVIEDVHDKITKVITNGKMVYEAPKKADKAKTSEEGSFNLKDIVDFALTVNTKKVSFLLEGVRLNRELTKLGLSEDWGLKVGKTMQAKIKKGYLSDDLVNHAVVQVSSAIDARMDGASLYAMSNSGSGDQGIVAFMGTYSLAEKLDIDDERLLRGLVLSNLIPIYIKMKLGRLSALCGVVIAGVGVASALTYMLGGGYDEIVFALDNHIAGISGLYCDGAKTSCSLKAAAAVGSSVYSGLLGADRIGVRGFEGIIDYDVEKTIENMVSLATIGMADTDRMILDIIRNKK